MNFSLSVSTLEFSFFEPNPVSVFLFLIPPREKPYNLESIWHRCLRTIISLFLFNFFVKIKKSWFPFCVLWPFITWICLKWFTTKIHSRFGMIIFFDEAQCVVSEYLGSIQWHLDNPLTEPIDCLEAVKKFELFLSVVLFTSFCTSMIISCHIRSPVHHDDPWFRYDTPAPVSHRSWVQIPYRPEFFSGLIFNY